MSHLTYALEWDSQLIKDADLFLPFVVPPHTAVLTSEDITKFQPSIDTRPIVIACIRQAEKIDVGVTLICPHFGSRDRGYYQLLSTLTICILCCLLTKLAFQNKNYLSVICS
jgi:hypothetical protein